MFINMLYATLVLSGHYEEAGDSGHHLARAGDVILHDALAAHRNRFPYAAMVLNISLPDKYAFQPGLGQSR